MASSLESLKDVAYQFEAKCVAAKIMNHYQESLGKGDSSFEATLFPAMDLVISHDAEKKKTSFQIINRKGPGAADDLVVDSGKTVGPRFGPVWCDLICGLLAFHIEQYLLFAGDDAESLSQSSSRSSSPEPLK